MSSQEIKLKLKVAKDAVSKGNMKQAIEACKVSRYLQSIVTGRMNRIDLHVFTMISGYPQRRQRSLHGALADSESISRL